MFLRWRIPVPSAMLAVLLLAALGQVFTAIVVPVYALCGENTPRTACGRDPKNCSCALLNKAIRQCCCSTPKPATAKLQGEAKKSCCSAKKLVAAPATETVARHAAPCKCTSSGDDTQSLLPEMAPPAVALNLPGAEPQSGGVLVLNWPHTSLPPAHTAPPPKA